MKLINHYSKKQHYEQPETHKLKSTFLESQRQEDGNCKEDRTNDTLALAIASVRTTVLRMYSVASDFRS